MRCSNSMPEIVTAACLKILKPSMGVTNGFLDASMDPRFRLEPREGFIKAYKVAGTAGRRDAHRC